MSIFSFWFCIGEQEKWHTNITANSACVLSHELLLLILVQNLSVCIKSGVCCACAQDAEDRPFVATMPKALKQAIHRAGEDLEMSNHGTEEEFFSEGNLNRRIPFPKSREQQKEQQKHEEEQVCVALRFLLCVLSKRNASSCKSRCTLAVLASLKSNNSCCV